MAKAAENTPTQDRKDKQMANKKAVSKVAKSATLGSNRANRDELLGFYREMLRIRRFEEKAGQLYGMGLIGGFCHLYIGQEAVVVGAMASTNENDSVVTSYRDHGHMLSCGMDAKRVMAELTGRRDGYSRGKGGSMHMFSEEKNFYGGHGIVGAQTPIGAGLAFAHKYREDGGASLAFLGDGAVNQGQVYETLNMAALWSLPVVIMIENNRYGMGTSQERASAGELFRRGEAYGILGEQVDGMDVLAVRDASARALAHARTKGPMVLELMTYRYRGHSMSDPAKYRTKSEVSEIREHHDPIDHVRDLLVGLGEQETDLKAIDKGIRDEMNVAANFAKENPEPDISELWTDVYSDNKLPEFSGAV